MERRETIPFFFLSENVEKVCTREREREIKETIQARQGKSFRILLYSKCNFFLVSARCKYISDYYSAKNSANPYNLGYMRFLFIERLARGLLSPMHVETTYTYIHIHMYKYVCMYVCISR